LYSSELAHSAYARPDAPQRAPRALEYDAFALVTRRLAAAPGASAGFPRLAAALDDNRRLWRTLAADVADPGNALPATLRARIFYLYEFTEAHTRRVLDGAADPQVLVDINTAVMRGLRGDGGAA
jgi:flagellar protein FlaF